MAEGVTGVCLLALPQIVVRLLFASEISGSAVMIIRIAGIGLIGLAVFCWAGKHTSGAFTRDADVQRARPAGPYIYWRPWRKGRGYYCGQLLSPMQSLSCSFCARDSKSERQPANVNPELMSCCPGWRQLVNEVSVVAEPQPAAETSARRVDGSLPVIKRWSARAPAALPAAGSRAVWRVHLFTSRPRRSRVFQADRPQPRRPSHDGHVLRVAMASPADSC